MEEVEDEPLFAERAAGLDIAKAGLVAAVRVPGRGGRRMQEMRSCGATRRELEELADWLEGHGVSRVGMESTSVIRGSNRYEMDIGQVGQSRTPYATEGQKRH